MLYVLVVLICGVILSIVNCLFFLNYLNLLWWQVVLVVFAFVIAEFAIDGLFAFIVNKLPKKIFNKNSKIFKIYKWERRFYEKIGIKKWKDHIPELGKLGNFSKSKLENPNDNTYVDRFIKECVIGEVVHVCGIIFGFTVLFYFRFALTIGLPVAIINIFLNIPSIMILRYNRPKLEVILEMNRRLAERKKQKIIND